MPRVETNKRSRGQPDLLPSAPSQPPRPHSEALQADRHPGAGSPWPAPALPLGPPHSCHRCLKIRRAVNASEGWPGNLNSPQTISKRRAGLGLFCPRSPLGLSLCSYQEPGPLGPLSLPAVSALTQERLKDSLPLEHRGCPEMGRGRGGMEWVSCSKGCCCRVGRIGASLRG